MDNQGHPIPQDITGFQFRLIGDMTIKQFAYVAFCTGLAWLTFILPIPFIVKAPLAVCIGLIGIMLAFLPIQGRPADMMVLLFIKALFRPNQYQYNLSKQKQTTTTAVMPTVDTTKKESQETPMTMLDSQPNIPVPQTIHQEETPIAPEPIKEIPQQEDVKEQETILEENLQEAQKEEQQAIAGSVEATQAHEKVVALETQMQDLLSQRQDMERELVSLRQQLEEKKQQVYTPATAQEPLQTSHVKKIPQSMQASVGAPFIPDVPNLISGVVKDARGNVLPNILVEVKDKENSPVRAFKTNALGQFLSATPVLNGTYTITFEDPKKQQKFDTIEIVASGTILQPLEVTSIDAREELRKQLFA